MFDHRLLQSCVVDQIFVVRHNIVSMDVSCRICSKIFNIKPSHRKLGWGKYCSIECRSKSQLKGKIVTCHLCGKLVYRSPNKLLHSKSGKYFCDKSCQTLWRNSLFSGENSPKWVNGKRAYRKILLRNNIMPKCCICNNKETKVLNAHHKDHNRSNNKISNLVWLCLNCHYLVHHDTKLDILVKSLHK